MKFHHFQTSSPAGRSGQHPRRGGRPHGSRPEGQDREQQAGPGGPGGFGGPGRGHRGGPGGPRGGGRGGPDGDGLRGRGGRAGRLFEQGDLRLLVLHLLAEQPAHGYELIKAIEQLVGGDYSPSPGVIYPTLTYLAELGWAEASEPTAGRKQYAITAEGRAQLAAQQAELQGLLAKLTGKRHEASARGAPEIQRAMSNLKMALQLRFGQGSPDPAMIRQVAALIDQAALNIEQL